MPFWVNLADCKITSEKNSCLVLLHCWAAYRNLYWTIWRMPREPAGLIVPKSSSEQENSETCWFMNTWRRPNSFWNAASCRWGDAHAHRCCNQDQTTS